MAVTCCDPIHMVVTVGLSCHPREHVLVPVGILFSPCLKNWTLFLFSGVLLGCCMVGIGRRSLLSWGELSPRRHLHRGSTRVLHLPPHASLLGWTCYSSQLPAECTAGRGRCCYPCQVTAAVVRVGAGAQPAVCGKIYSWLLALASSSLSRCQQQCLMDIYSHLLFSGLCFLV